MQSEVAQVRVKCGQNRKLIAPADAASSTPLVLGRPKTAPALPVDESLAHPTTVANSHVMWGNVAGIAAYHGVALLAVVPWFFSWTGVAAAVVGLYVFGTLGINFASTGC